MSKRRPIVRPKVSGRGILILPIITGLMYCLTPEWIPKLGYPAVFLLTLSILWAIFGGFKPLPFGDPRPPKYRLFFSVQIYLCGIFLIGSMWKYWYTSVWLGVALLFLGVLTVYLSNKYRPALLKVVNHPKKKSRLYYFVFALFVIPLFVGIFGNNRYPTSDSGWRKVILEPLFGYDGSYQFIITLLSPLGFFCLIMATLAYPSRQP